MDEPTDLTQKPDYWTKGWPATVMPPPDATSFIANGREYRISRSISFQRYEAYQILEVELGLARTLDQFQEQVNEAYSLCNQVAAGKHVFADLAVLLRDMHIGTRLIGQGEIPTVLKLCALFINREGEDVRVVDEGTIDAKVHDWQQAGIDVRYFFGFALNSIPGYIEALRAASLDTSKGTGEFRAENGDGESTSRPASKRSDT